MDKLTVKTLRRWLESALDQLEEYEDGDIVQTSPNTRFCGDRCLQCGRAGFIDLNDIEVIPQYDDDDAYESRRLIPRHERRIPRFIARKR